MGPMPEAEAASEDTSGDGLPDGHAFRMELYSNRGDAMEKMGVVDPEDKTLWRKLFDLFL